MWDMRHDTFIRIDTLVWHDSWIWHDTFICATYDDSIHRIQGRMCLSSCVGILLSCLAFIASAALCSCLHSGFYVFLFHPSETCLVYSACTVHSCKVPLGCIAARDLAGIFDSYFLRTQSDGKGAKGIWGSKSLCHTAPAVSTAQHPCWRPCLMCHLQSLSVSHVSRDVWKTLRHAFLMAHGVANNLFEDLEGWQGDYKARFHRVPRDIGTAKGHQDISFLHCHFVGTSSLCFKLHRVKTRLVGRKIGITPLSLDFI